MTAIGLALTILVTGIGCFVYDINSASGRHEYLKGLGGIIALGMMISFAAGILVGFALS
jgi:hypothetical protein